MARTISKEKAYYLTTLWGSYMHSGDPGACMYGFPIDDGRPQDNEHRLRCIAYIRGMLNEPVNKFGEAMPKSHAKELKSLLHWFKFCPLIA